MRPRRRVVVTIEIDTDAPLSELRTKHRWRFDGSGERLGGVQSSRVVQVQATAVRPGR